MRSTPNSSHASISRVGTISRSRYSTSRTTKRDGMKDESGSDSDSDSESDGGAPLFTPPSRDNKTLGNSSHEENRRAKRYDGGSEDLGRPTQHELVDRHHHHHQQFQHGHHRANNSNIKTDDAAQIIHHGHYRPKTLLASFRPGITLPLEIRTEPDYDAYPAYFSTRFIVKRAVARVQQARRLDDLPSLDHPGRIESLIDGIGRQQTNDVEQQTNDVEQQTDDVDQQTNDVEQHHIKGRGRGTYPKSPTSPPYVITRQAFNHDPLTTTTTTTRKTNYNYCSRPLAAQVPKPPPPTATTTITAPPHRKSHSRNFHYYKKNQRLLSPTRTLHSLPFRRRSPRFV
ncbi:hypothetical protein QR685DRAFT_527590 [Neurospora intermedia]|uniref:Uncharacterized protein n=1 Tax=Neurospora intermedia TaxID=5142 RepID=A0ABR3DC13_NEUIN